MLDARSQPVMRYILIAAWAGQPPIRVFTLTVTLRGLPERRRFIHVGGSELAYNEIYLDGRPSRTTAYTGLHPNSVPSWGIPKYLDLLTLTTRRHHAPEGPTSEPTVLLEPTWWHNLEDERSPYPGKHLQVPSGNESHSRTTFKIIPNISEPERIPEQAQQRVKSQIL